MSKFQGVLKMFMLGVLKTILKTVLKYEKNTITLYSTCWNWAADFVFLLRFCARKRSETFIFCSQGTKAEVEGFLPIEIEAMKGSVDNCLTYVRDTEAAFNQVHIWWTLSTLVTELDAKPWQCTCSMPLVDIILPWSSITWIACITPLMIGSGTQSGHAYHRNASYHFYVKWMKMNLSLYLM